MEEDKEGAWDVVVIINTYSPDGFLKSRTVNGVPIPLTDFEKENTRVYFWNGAPKGDVCERTEMNRAEYENDYLLPYQ